MARTVLVHLNVEVPDNDIRPAGSIADSIMEAIEVGSDDHSVRDLNVAMALAEEI